MDISEEVIQVKNSLYQRRQEIGVPPRESMVAFAKELSNKRENLGIKLALASSASMKEILQNLWQIGLEAAFDLIVSGRDDLDGYVDLDGKNKPKPYIYNEVSKRLNIVPSHCVVFEDTQAGIEAAVQAGMVAVAVPNEYRFKQDFSKATKVIWSDTELAKNFRL